MKGGAGHSCARSWSPPARSALHHRRRFEAGEALGEKFAVPVAVVPFGWRQTADRIRGLVASRCCERTVTPPSGQTIMFDPGLRVRPNRRARPGWLPIEDARRGGSRPVPRDGLAGDRRRCVRRGRAGAPDRRRVSASPVSPSVGNSPTPRSSRLISAALDRSVVTSADGTIFGEDIRPTDAEVPGHAVIGRLVASARAAVAASGLSVGSYVAAGVTRPAPSISTTACSTSHRTCRGWDTVPLAPALCAPESSPSSRPTPTRRRTASGVMVLARAPAT